MIFHKTRLPGAFEIEIEPITDERGFFARSWCQTEFASHGLNPLLAQCNISLTSRKGTLRGLHYQEAPFAEAKLVRCTRGSIYDIVVDLRRNSSTFTEWTAVVLTAQKHNMLFVPEGCGHGFLTLEDDVEVAYQMSTFYNPDSARGVRWNDPAFRISLPSQVEVISERDRTYSDFEPQR